ncbi:MAG: hypothetical protein IJS74_03990 [Clostridia bacterium]|nr:hypothetical protein [Clostridia bacterium]
MENGARIYNKHMQIENEEDLLDYLYDIFDSNYKNDYLNIKVENDPRDRSQDLISGKRKEIMDCSSQNLAVGEEPDQSELLIKYYQLYFLINKTCKMFGIKCNPPSDDSFNLTKEYKAWERWWSDGMTEALTKQETFDDVTMGKYGYNPKFRPKGSYKDLLKKDVKGSAQSKPDDKQDDLKQK